MGFNARVARRHDVPVIDHDGIDLVADRDAAAFLDACAAEGLTVLGIEVFSRTMQADPDVLPDLSRASDSPASIRYAKRFVHDFGGRYAFYDFILASPSLFRPLTLRGYFEGSVAAAALDEVVIASRSAWRPGESGVDAYVWEQDATDFRVTRSMMLALCDDTLQERISLEALSPIAAMAVSCPMFDWTDDRVGVVLEEWRAAAIDGRPTEADVSRCRRDLEPPAG